MVTVNVRDASTHLSHLIARAEAGEEIVITRNGAPVVRLTPVSPRGQRGPREPGSWKGRIFIDDSFFDPLPDEELAAWDGRAAGDAPSR